jgi:ABC-type branched-subunit amino acid transport system permease subunit
MITKNLRQGVRSGILMGITIIFLILVGAIFILVKLIGGALHQTPEVSLRLILILVYLVAGAQLTRLTANKTRPFWGHDLLKATSAGAVAGLIIALTTFVIISLQEKGLNLRTYLYQLSPVSLTLWAQGLSAQFAAFFHFLLPLITFLLGAVLALLVRKLRLKEQLSRWITPSQALGNRLFTPLTRSIWGKIVLFGLMGVLLIVGPMRLNDYWNFTLGTVGIYVMMGLGLNIVVGLAGLLDLGYVVFFAVGSYTMALLTAPTPHDIMWNFWLVLPIAVGLAAIIGVLLGIPVLRLRGDYLAIVTLGFGEIIRVLLKAESLSGFSNGPRGIPKIGQPAFFGIPFNSERDFMYMIILAVILVIFLTIRLQNSKIGRAWIAIREDETVAQAMGINTLKAKLLAFGIGAAFAGMGGALFASRSQFTGPDDFTLMISINVLAVVIVGGMGSIPGVIAGAFVLKGLPEILRDLESYRILAFGALLVVMMIYRPQGLIPSTRRRLTMRDEKKPQSTSEAPVPSSEGSEKS